MINGYGLKEKNRDVVMVKNIKLNFDQAFSIVLFILLLLMLML